MDISVIVPLYNEEESLPELHAWIKRVMDANHFSYEIIFVNDGSTDGSWKVIESLSKENKEVKGVKFRALLQLSALLFLKSLPVLKKLWKLKKECCLPDEEIYHCRSRWQRFTYGRRYSQTVSSN